MLEVIISPAKQMRVARDAFAPQGIPPYPRETERLWRALYDIECTQGPDGLQALWGVNEKLLAENIERLRDFVPVAGVDALDDAAVAKRVSAAVFSYVGIQYRSMAPEVMDEDALAWLAEHLWILSGLYGCVRPFDAVAPYRLEMGAKLAVGGARDLYAFWDDKLARAIEGDARSDGRAASAGDAEERDAAAATDGGVVTVVNLASVEYARAVLPHLSPSAQVITCIFGEALRSGKPVQRATASKIARGSMVRWMAEHSVADARELERFDVGYRLVPELSATVARLRTPAAHTTLVFMRAE